MDNLDSDSKSKETLIVLLSGICTTALALGLVWLINNNTRDFDIMLYYVYYVFPVGAIFIGAVAGIGYGISSWITGIRISKKLLLIIILIQAFAYFTAQYIEYMQIIGRRGRSISFFKYFDMITRSFSWVDDDGRTGSPLGFAGYFFRVLEIAGFVLSGIIAPLVLKAVPFCEKCQRYMKTKQLCVIPAGIRYKSIRKKDTEKREKYDNESRAVWNKGMEFLENLKQQVSFNNYSEFNSNIELMKSKRREANQAYTRLLVKLHFCEGCKTGYLDFEQHTGQGRYINITKIGKIELNPLFLENILK